MMSTSTHHETTAEDCCDGNQELRRIRNSGRYRDHEYTQISINLLRSQSKTCATNVALRSLQAFTRLIGNMCKQAEDRPTDTGKPDGAMACELARQGSSGAIDHG